MKKIISYLGIATIVVAFAACGSKKETKSTETTTVPEPEAAEAVAGDPIALGEALVKANDCKTCHHKVNKIIGPAHTDVAKKYEFTKANVEMLAQKIIKGGVGVWGEIPMSPHADLSMGDAEKMARYVLSLDGEKEH